MDSDITKLPKNAYNYVCFWYWKSQFSIFQCRQLFLFSRGFDFSIPEVLKNKQLDLRSLLRKLMRLRSLGCAIFLKNKTEALPKILNGSHPSTSPSTVFNSPKFIRSKLSECWCLNWKLVQSVLREFENDSFWFSNFLLVKTSGWISLIEFLNDGLLLFGGHSFIILYALSLSSKNW